MNIINELKLKWESIKVLERVFWIFVLISILGLGWRLNLFFPSVILCLIITLGVITLDAISRPLIFTTIALFFAIPSLFIQYQNLQTQIDSLERTYRPYINIVWPDEIKKDPKMENYVVIDIPLRNCGKSPALNITTKTISYYINNTTKKRFEALKFQTIPSFVLFPDERRVQTLSISNEAHEKIKNQIEMGNTFYLTETVYYDSPKNKGYLTECTFFYDSTHNRFEPNPCRVE